MLPIILMIFKILGILVLALLGLAFFLILLMLLVPLRYRISGSYPGVPWGKVKVTWLLHILSMTILYEDGIKIAFRLFGFRLKKNVRKVLRDGEDMLVHATQVMDQPDELDEIRINRRDGASDALYTPEALDASCTPEALEALENREISDASEEPNMLNTSSMINSLQVSEAEEAEKAVKAEKAKSQPESHLDADSQAPVRRKARPTLWWSGFKKKIEQALRKQIRRFLSVFAKLKFLFWDICGKLKRMMEKVDELHAWLKDEKNKKTIRLLYRLIRKLIRHLIPARGRVEVVFGFDDPYVTGQALTAFSVIYPFFHKRLGVTPVFDKKIFTAKGTFKGRVRVGTLLVIAGRALLHKNFRVLLKRWL